MPPVPAVRDSQVVGALEKAGFAIARIKRQSPRHAPSRWQADYRSCPAGRDIRLATLRNILRNTGLTVEEFRRLL